MITNEYLKEQACLLLQVYKQKKNLDLFLTSGNRHCFDTTYEQKYVESIPEVLFNEFNYKNIYCDSRYISNELASDIQNKYNKKVIIKLYNNNEYDRYKDLKCINYIDNIKYYNQNIKNIYILNDDNINLDLIEKTNIELVENNLSIFNDDVKKLFTWQEYNKLLLPWEDYREWILRDCCLANNTFTFDVHTNEIIICPALNIKALQLGKIIDNEIISYHADIAIKLISSDTRNSKLECCNCKLYTICKQQCYYNSFKNTRDPFLKDEVNCIYSLRKANFFATLYDKAGIRAKAIEHNDKELLSFINTYLLRR